MTIEFRDGTTASADFVVSCDGIHSSLRAQFSTDRPKYSGRVAYRGQVNIDRTESWWALATYSVSWLRKDKHFLVFPISQNKTLNVVAFVATPEIELRDLKESWTATGSRTQLEKDFEGFGVLSSVCQNILRSGCRMTGNRWSSGYLPMARSC